MFRVTKNTKYSELQNKIQNNLQNKIGMFRVTKNTKYSELQNRYRKTKTLKDNKHLWGMHQSYAEWGNSKFLE